MSGKVIETRNISGLTLREIQVLQERYGKNIFHTGPSRGFIRIVWDIAKEPMFVLLVIACVLYFVLGEISEGILMLVAMIFVSAISLYQEVRSTNALKALQQYAAPKVRVIRDDAEMVISSEELVPGDIMLLEEGMNIPADAIILRENDLTINESIITGESLPVDKHETEGHNILFQGTTINSGKCIARVTATANATVLGKLGKSIGEYHSSKTFLQQQVSLFVRRLALFGLIGFLIIFIVNYLNQQQLAASLLFALTLAMSAIPEEIPVAFSSFMALGAFKMSKLGIISRQPQIIENLGAVGVVCLDKTGTITENNMVVKTVYDHGTKTLADMNDKMGMGHQNVLLYGMMASESDPFDAMEKAIVDAYQQQAAGKGAERPKMVYEYPLEGHPPMMTHIYEDVSGKVIAGKGAVERIVRVCKPGKADEELVMALAKSLASKGYRIIAVASAAHEEIPLPDMQDNFNWHFSGLLALYDPPKKNIAGVISKFYKAGIDVKLVTGDYPETAMNIAGQVGIENNAHYITGEQVIKMGNEELRQAVKDVNIYARMFPDAKLKVIDALKANGEIVAMTGDGVNDGPALKSADIGIAMGQRGTEIAQQASDLVLTDDNLDRMVAAIVEGRKIFSNLKKGVRYIISIHIPIIFTASLPVIFGWAYPNIFTPIHVIFLELIMGPTCSVFFEKEPVEETIMEQMPRERGRGLFTKEELLISVVQGIVITLGVLILYYYWMHAGSTLEQTRTIVFTTLILSNVFLTFANRSFTKTIYVTGRYKNPLVPVILIVSILFLAALHFIPFVRDVFQLAEITAGQFWLCFGVALSSVMWFEVYKTNLPDNSHISR